MERKRRQETCFTLLCSHLLIPLFVAKRHKNTEYFLAGALYKAMTKAFHQRLTIFLVEPIIMQICRAAYFHCKFPDTIMLAMLP